MPGSKFQGSDEGTKTGTALDKTSDAPYSEAVLRMPRKPAIELVDSRTLSLHSLFALLTTVAASFATAMWTAYFTTEATGWILTAAAMLTVFALGFMITAIVAYIRMHSKKYNVEVSLKDIGDVSSLVQQEYLGGPRHE